MAVRNFWIDAEIDGRRTRLTGGPVSKDGGFSLTVYIRDNGGIEKAVRLDARAFEDGELMLDVVPNPDLLPKDEHGWVPVEHTPGAFRLVAKR